MVAKSQAETFAWWFAASHGDVDTRNDVLAKDDIVARVAARFEVDPRVLADRIIYFQNLLRSSPFIGKE